MSAAFKLVTLASSFGLLGAGTAYALKTPARDFSSSALALDHTADTTAPAVVKPKLPSTFISLQVGKYEFKNAA